MKNIVKDSISKLKSLKINLLDGQRRGEIIFRRVFLLALLYLILVYLAHTFGPSIKGTEGITKAEEVPVEVVDTTPKDGDVIRGQVVDVDDGGKVWYVQEYTPKNPEIDKIREFVKSYKGKISDTYFNQIVKACGEDASLVRTVVAISVAETGMGKATSNKSNFYGWFKNGNRKYDPSTQEMASEICRGVGKYYRNIGKNEAVTKRYVGGNVSNWTRNFNWAIKQM